LCELNFDGLYLSKNEPLVPGVVVLGLTLFENSHWITMDSRSKEMIILFSKEESIKIIFIFLIFFFL